jgi:hypothetical protein
MARTRRIDMVTSPAFDNLLAEAQWRTLKRGVPVYSRTQLIELGVAILVALEQYLESSGYKQFLPQEVVEGIGVNWAAIRGSELGYDVVPGDEG